MIEICAAEKIRCVEADLSVVDVYGANEMFCTGTMGELAAVTKIDNRVIGDGKVGSDDKTPERSLLSMHREPGDSGRLVVRPLPIMIAELCNKKLITDFLVNNSMLGSDPP